MDVFLLDHRSTGLRSAGSHAVLRVRAESSARAANTSTSTAYSASTRRSSPRRVRGTKKPTLFPVILRGTRSSPERSARRRRPAPSPSAEVYVFAPPSAGEATTRRPPDRVLMVEPEMAFAGPRRDMDLARTFLGHAWGACCSDGASSCTAGRDSQRSSACRSLSAIAYGPPPPPRGDRTAARRRRRRSWGDDPAPRRGPRVQQFDRPVMLLAIRAPPKAFYIRPIRTRGSRCAVDGLAPTLLRDHRRRPARVGISPP